MGNMAYCRFENTLHDLKDCRDHLNDVLDNDDERQARQQLVLLCREIADCDDEGIDYVCGECGETFGDEDDYDQHMADEHGEEDEDE